MRRRLVYLVEFREAAHPGEDDRPAVVENANIKSSEDRRPGTSKPLIRMSGTSRMQGLENTFSHTLA